VGGGIEWESGTGVECALERFWERGNARFPGDATPESKIQDLKNFLEAQDLISQAERVLTSSYDELLRKVQLMGQTSYRNELKIDSAFWAGMGAESGRSYKGRIVRRNSDWFDRESPKALEAELWSLIAREWQIALDSVNALLDIEDR